MMELWSQMRGLDTIHDSVLGALDDLTCPLHHRSLFGIEFVFCRSVDHQVYLEALLFRITKKLYPAEVMW